ncbi:hypothetical protein CEK29_15470 [Bordetella genomosp. 5]|uniref:EAL domain-containing protein n=1 Tax=Bordetella genomosp. 5 TaxID=1395608 RepID=A0A261TFH4_9BORD|nr:hypothetical protein [Bordetella genomosp. 5]OZI41335.1 hypothetical protein CEK29_15470 [Bordetella genomosp. 5]OZI47997.1 hypothetical protein CAL25_16555 [Bordetella genomosp. 5]
MKTQIQFKKTDGSEGVALVSGDATDVVQAKSALADQLARPPEAEGGQEASADERLRKAGIDPASVKGTHIAE